MNFISNQIFLLARIAHLGGIILLYGMFIAQVFVLFFPSLTLGGVYLTVSSSVMFLTIVGAVSLTFEYQKLFKNKESLFMIFFQKNIKK